LRYEVKPIVDTETIITAPGVVVEKPISFLGDVDKETGKLVQPDSELRGADLSGKILFAPFGRGSTVGSYIMYALKTSGLNPAAIVMHKAEPIIITGAVISGIPLFDGMPLEFYSRPRVIRKVVIRPGGVVEVFE
jgi:predicted aconitase with swiveling domain